MPSPSLPPSRSRRRHGRAGLPPEAGVPVREAGGVGDRRDDGRDDAVGGALHDARGHEAAVPGNIYWTHNFYFY